MSDHITEASLRTIFPPHPARWFWTRLKLYSAILAAVAACFFFVAGWYAAPINGDESRFFLVYVSISDALILATVMCSIFVTRRLRREMSNEEHHAAGSSQPPANFD